jgi:protein TonB
MFDLITGRVAHIPSRSTVPVLLSLTGQVVVMGTAIAISALWVGNTLPEIPTMMAFVAAPPAPPPPPPPPPPAAPAMKRAQPTAKPVPTVSEFAAPIDPPERIEPGLGDGEGFDEGVPGGVAGGIPGGVVGGIIGGLPEAPPPPPPPPPLPKGPVRVGGQITQPALLYRVEPIYPNIAVAARIQGISILETIVDEEGRVTDVRVMRSAGDILDREAIAAVRQWRYTPVVLNGSPVKFVLTVTLSFRLEDRKG